MEMLQNPFKTETEIEATTKYAQAGNLPSLKDQLGEELLRSQADSYKDFAKRLFLAAAKAGHAEVVRWLIERFPSMERDDEVQMAAFAGGSRIYVIFNSQWADTIDRYICYGSGNVLGLAIHEQDIAMVELLLSRGADPNAARWGEMPCMLKPWVIDNEILAMITSHGFFDIRKNPIRHRGWAIDPGFPPASLMEPYRTRYLREVANFAAAVGNLAHLKGQLGNKPPQPPTVDEYEGSDRRLFETAANVKHLHVVRWLIEERFPNMTPDGRVHVAAISGGAPIYSIFNRRYPHLIDQDLPQVGNPLGAAISRRDLDMVTLLLSRGADPNKAWRFDIRYCERPDQIKNEKIRALMVKYGMIDKQWDKSEEEFDEKAVLDKAESARCTIL